jgi:hypothetical protein
MEHSSAQVMIEGKGKHSGKFAGYLLRERKKIIFEKRFHQ